MWTQFSAGRMSKVMVEQIDYGLWKKINEAKSRMDQSYSYKDIPNAVSYAIALHNLLPTEFKQELEAIDAKEVDSAKLAVWIQTNKSKIDREYKAFLHAVLQARKRESTEQ
jgi:hypothetical protein